jgi:hypothetical protein
LSVTHVPDCRGRRGPCLRRTGRRSRWRQPRSKRRLPGPKWYGAPHTRTHLDTHTHTHIPPPRCLRICYLGCLRQATPLRVWLGERGGTSMSGSQHRSLACGHSGGAHRRLSRPRHSRKHRRRPPPPGRCTLAKMCQGPPRPQRPARRRRRSIRRSCVPSSSSSSSSRYRRQLR